MKNSELGNPGTVKSHGNTSYHNQIEDQTTQSHCTNDKTLPIHIKIKFCISLDRILLGNCNSDE